MSGHYLRVYKKFDIEKVKEQLLIVGDLGASCAGCKSMELTIDSVQCNECKVFFKYVTSRRHETHPGERFQFAKRIAENREDLTLIDYLDYKKILGQKEARDFFG